MSIDSLHIMLAALKAKGAIFNVSGDTDKLSVRAPRGIVSPDLRTYLSEHRTEVVRTLSNEWFIREWLSKRITEISFPSDLPAEFEERFESAIVQFIDGLIDFPELERAWTRFVAECHAGREIVEEQL